MATFEHVTAGTPIAAEPAAIPGNAEVGPPTIPSPSLRLQILATEHWSLLASRSLAWNEAFSRAGMFLATLSEAIVALALVAQATAFGDGFTLFALVILPVVLFIGVTTLIRVGASNYHDEMCVIGMNRIRAAYLEFAPELERYFVMSAHDDLRGIGITRAVPFGGGGSMPLAFMLSATPGTISVLNSVLVGVITAIAGLRFGSIASVAVALGVVGFLLAMVAQFMLARASIAKGQAGYRPLFPTP